MRILICDDNEDFARTLARSLTTVGHEVVVTLDGESCVTEAPSFAPHAVLLDIGLPGIDGYYVAQHLRRLPFGSDLLIVAISAYSMPADVKRAMAAGCDEHMRKPADLPELLTLLVRFKAKTRRS